MTNTSRGYGFINFKTEKARNRALHMDDPRVKVCTTFLMFHFFAWLGFFCTGVCSVSLSMFQLPSPSPVVCIATKLIVCHYGNRIATYVLLYFYYSMRKLHETNLCSRFSSSWPRRECIHLTHAHAILSSTKRWAHIYLRWCTSCVFDENVLAKSHTHLLLSLAVLGSPRKFLTSLLVDLIWFPCPLAISIW